MLAKRLLPIFVKFSKRKHPVLLTMKAETYAFTIINES